jgi:DNA replication licensing factor MCM5
MLSLEEEEKIKLIAKEKNIYERISRSIGNAIFGSEDIKKAISCLLFSGTTKILPD